MSGLRDLSLGEQLEEYKADSVQAKRDRASDVDADLDIAKRATAVERERCLDAVEALYTDLAPPTDSRHWIERGEKQRMRDALVNVGMTIAGGDAGPHSEAALAWRARVTGTGETVPA